MVLSKASTGKLSKILYNRQLRTRIIAHYGVPESAKINFLSFAVKTGGNVYLAKIQQLYLPGGKRRKDNIPKLSLASKIKFLNVVFYPVPSRKIKFLNFGGINVPSCFYCEG